MAWVKNNKFRGNSVRGTKDRPQGCTSKLSAELKFSLSLFMHRWGGGGARTLKLDCRCCRSSIEGDSSEVSFVDMGSLTRFV